MYWRRMSRATGRGRPIGVNTPETVRNMRRDLGQVGVWLSAAGRETSQFNEEWAWRF